MTPADPIKHVIVLMLENRSFDHMLGGLSPVIPGLNGVDPAASRGNKDYDGTEYKQVGGAAYDLNYDPKHELQHVAHQMSGGNAGFVEDFSRSYHLSQSSDRAEIMKYFEDGRLPALHTLAKNFGVCDQWFSSVPGPTWANRFFMHSGTSIGIVSMPEGIMDANLHWYDQTTLYDRLNEKKITWRIYYSDIPQSLMLVHQMEPHNVKNYFKMHQFYLDVAADEKEFPQYSFIEPAYYPPGASDDHPPHDIMEGEKLIAEIYNALRRNDDLWKSTLFIVLFDEHGGLYDHVVPPPAVPPDHYAQEYDFTQLGIRVPAILISPYVAKGVIKERFDHTSILKYAIDKWNLGPLGQRAENANSIAMAIQTTIQPETPKVLPLLLPPADQDKINQYGQLSGREQPGLSEHQSALVGMTQLLEAATDVEGHKLMGRIKRMVTGFDGVVDVAIERVDEFVDQQRQVSKD
jgi:phospholipase C